MFGTVSEIDDFFRMVESKAAATADVAGVGGGRRVTIVQRLGHGGVADHSGPSAVADCLELSVPSRGGQPNFDLDVRVGGGGERRCDPAEGRKILEGDWLRRSSSEDTTWRG